MSADEYLERIWRIHVPHPRRNWCDDCCQEWPCNTIQIINEYRAPGLPVHTLNEYRSPDIQSDPTPNPNK